MNNHRKLPVPRMSTGFERVFRQVSQNPDIYQEFLLHFIHKLAEDGTKLNSKLDKSVPGSYYKEAREHEHSTYGEHTYVFPDGIQRRLIVIKSR